MGNGLIQLRSYKTSTWQSRGYRIENINIPGWKFGGFHEVVNILIYLGMVSLP